MEQSPEEAQARQAVQSQTGSGYTYIISNEAGFIKIGQSSDPEGRRKTIESVSGIPCVLEHQVVGAHVEKLAHEALAQYRTIGEWFDCPLKLAVETVNRVKEEYEQFLYDSILGALQASKPKDKAELEEGGKPLEELLKMPVEHMTKHDISRVCAWQIKRLVDEAGNIPHLAKMLDCPLPTVQSWVSRKQISKSGAKLVQEHPYLGQKFKAYELRPDLYL